MPLSAPAPLPPSSASVPSPFLATPAEEELLATSVLPCSELPVPALDVPSSPSSASSGSAIDAETLLDPPLPPPPPIDCA